MRPRWSKVLSDLSGNPVRTFLVILSVIVGLFAVGMIITVHLAVKNDIRSGYKMINPANILIAVSGIDSDTLESIRRTEGVKEADGVRKFEQKVFNIDGEWERIEIAARKEFENIQVNQLILKNGDLIPKEGEILIDQNKIEQVYINEDQKIYLELSTGDVKEYGLTGIVQDQTIGSDEGGGHFFLAPVQGYVNWDSLPELSQPQTYNQLLITTTERYQNRQEIRRIADSLVNKLENQQIVVLHTVVRESEAHPNAIYVDAIASVLIVLGFLVVFLSGFLITNTLTALMNQQNKQIGIMKSVGATRKQIVIIYMVLIFTYGILAFFVSVPFFRQAGFSLVDYLASQVNFVFLGKRWQWMPVIFVLVIALFVPQISGFWPIIKGSRVKVQQAFSGDSMSVEESQDRWLHKTLKKIKGLPRPFLIAIRNSFRKRGRVFLTIFTLMLGGAIFISTFNVQNSLKKHIQQTGEYFLADVNLVFERPYRIERVQEELRNIPGIRGVEGWAFASSEIVFENDTVGDSVSLLGPPPETELINATVMEGRWIQPGDHRNVVVNEVFQTNFPHLSVGEKIRLRVNGEETEWTIIGFFQLAGKSAGYIAYTDYESLASIGANPNRTAVYRIAAEEENLSLDQQKMLSNLVSAQLRSRGYQVNHTEAGLELLSSTTDGITILTVFLLIMAILMALVGSIGLMGTMSLNVMERTREIGVMRAIGASDNMIIRMVLMEGLVIGLMSWLISIIAAVPITRLLGDTISKAIFDSPGLFSFTFRGVLIWFLIVVVLSMLASLLPAWNAARLTIREVLAYE